jgi:integrase
VQQAMGHSSIVTTMGYYAYVPEHLRSLVDVPADAPAIAARG